jgi:hypothetical protein
LKIVYIASPYHADTPAEMEENRQAALSYCGEVYRLGRLSGHKIIPVTPIGLFPYLDDDKPEERRQALRMGAALLSKCDELWVAGSHVSEGMRGEIRTAARLSKPIYSMGVKQEKIQAAIDGMRPMLEESVCYKHSGEKDFTNQLLVLKHSNLAPWAQEPENQLWIADSGFGCSPSASGRAVYATNLFDGEKARWNRSDFCGVAIENRLPEWARDRFEEYQQANNNEESEEIEP